MVARSIILCPTLLQRMSFIAASPVSFFRAPAGSCAVRCASMKPCTGEKKSPARMAEVPRRGIKLPEVAWSLSPKLFLEKNRINKDGELVISSTKTRTQKGNTEDALWKLQAIIDAASYVPPPHSEEMVKKVAKFSATGEQKRLDKKKALSQKKAR